MARLGLNLASRPFVNARPLLVATAVATALLALLTFLNFYWLFGAWKEAAVLGAQLAVTRAEIAEAGKSTEALQKSISESERRRIRAVSVTTREIIEKRRLAWTRLFDQLEMVLPRQVRVLSVVPEIRDGGMVLLMQATARDNEVKLKFYRKLQERPFSEAYILGETIEADKIHFSIRCNYDREGGDADPIYEPMPWELPRPTPTLTPASATATSAAAAPLRSGAPEPLLPGEAAPRLATSTPVRPQAPGEEGTDPSLLGGFAPASAEEEP